MADKYFERREAEELLPTLVPWLEEARDEKQKIEAFKNEMAQVASRIMVLGGYSPPLGDLLRKKSEHDETAEHLVEIVNRIQETGVLVKDLDIGLVDFPSLVERRRDLPLLETRRGSHHLLARHRRGVLRPQAN